MELIDFSRMFHLLRFFADLAKIAETRQNIPILVQRRTDVYDVLHHRL